MKNLTITKMGLQVLLILLLAMLYISCESLNSTAPESGTENTRYAIGTENYRNLLPADLPTYPMQESTLVAYDAANAAYASASIVLTNGSSLSFSASSLMAPDGFAAEPLLITFSATIADNQLHYNFTPQGCSFTTPATVTLNYSDIFGMGAARLFYIAENGDYIEIQPASHNLFFKTMTIQVTQWAEYIISY